jgi:hypothetical protein
MSSISGIIVGQLPPEVVYIYEDALPLTDQTVPSGENRVFILSGYKNIGTGDYDFSVELGEVEGVTVESLKVYKNGVVVTGAVRLEPNQSCDVEVKVMPVAIAPSDPVTTVPFSLEVVETWIEVI